ncbi:MAG: fructose bisphosphate aldolase [Lapillicoccus sp.]
MTDTRDEQRAQITHGRGFFAALDQSGGSTPKALKEYGIDESQYSDDAEMFDLVHAMRTRVITDPAFSGDRILAAILFQQTMDRTIEGVGTAAYLWERKHVVPLLKIDQGLADEERGVQLMKPIDGLDAQLDHAVDKGIFGTKMRSVITHADEGGIAAVVEQQLAYARQVLAHGLVPILEPEVSIGSDDKGHSEELLKAGVLAGLDALPSDVQVMLKISIPDRDGFYDDVMAHPRMMRVVALSGGYSREEADERLSRNPGLTASFSRALLEGLSAQQSDEEFSATLERSVEEIFAASTG